MAEDRNLQYGQELAELIRIPTVSRRDSTDRQVFYEFQEALEAHFPHLFAQAEQEDFDGSLLLRWKGSGTGLPVMFMNHFDVVAASGSWKYPPFSGTIAEDRVWGRGTLDTKGGLYCMLKAADELAAKGFVPRQDIYFVSSCTEETTGAGAKAISLELKRRGLRFAFCLDEGGMIKYAPVSGVEAFFAVIGVGEKACMELKFIARSRGGHASTPGKNTPLVRLGKFMAEAEKERGLLFPAKLSDPVREMFARMAEHTKTPVKTAIRELLKAPRLTEKLVPLAGASAEAYVRTTMAFTMAKGSDATNVLPQEAWVLGDMRISHHQGAAGSLKAVTRLAKRFDIEVEVQDPGFESPLSDFHCEPFRLLERAVRANFPEVQTAPYIMTGASDCSYMSRVSDNCYHFVPFVIDEQQLESIHGMDENVALADLAPAVDFYQFLMQEA